MVSPSNPDPAEDLPSQDLAEQQLCDYLDNQLGAIERSEFEKLLHDDAGLMVQLSQMRYLRESLKQIARRDTGIKLDPGFPDRVLQAAVARARDEGLAEDHPLNLVAEQPMRSVATAASFWNRRMVGVIAAVAATIALVTLLKSPEQTKEIPAVALMGEVDTDSLNATLPESIAADSVASRIASATSPPAFAASIGNDDTERDDKMIERTKIDNKRSIAEAVNRGQGRSIADASIAMSGSDSSASSAASSVAMNPTKHATSISAIMVLDIRQTDSGRLAKAVRHALRQAGIQKSDERSMTSDIAEAAVETVGIDDGEMVSLLYLQASAKSIDRFYQNLFGNQDGIDSVSLAIATDTPLLEMVKNTSIDPTTISHQGGAAIELDAGAEMVATQVGQLDFIPMTRATASSMTSSKGPDFTAKLLVVIR